MGPSLRWILSPPMLDLARSNDFDKVSITTQHVIVR
jgi:hypothetical protein